MSDFNLSIHNILCPTDFSEFATSAFEESVRLARWFGAKVTVLHVISMPEPITGDRGYLPIPASLSDELRAARLEELRRFVDATEHTGVPLETVCLDGDARSRIRETAREIGADLIVMGTHGRSGFKRLVLGSVTEALLRHAPVPVVTVHRSLPRRKGLFRTMLCATDLSEASAGTIALALSLADEGAKRLTVLHVIDAGVESPKVFLERAALAALQTLIPDEARTSYRIEEHVAFGDADREILRVAADEDADVIVLGTGGRRGVALFGSTVRRIVRDAICPVLVVPAGHVWPATGLVRRDSREAAGASREAKGPTP